MTRGEAWALLREVMKEYAPRNNVFDTDDARMRALKHILATKLTEAERRVIILYAEVPSSRRIGPALNTNRMTLQRQINRIKTKIKNELERYTRACGTHPRSGVRDR